MQPSGGMKFSILSDTEIIVLADYVIWLLISFFYSCTGWQDFYIHNARHAAEHRAFTVGCLRLKHTRTCCENKHSKNTGLWCLKHITRLLGCYKHEIKIIYNGVKITVGFVHWFENKNNNPNWVFNPTF